MGLQSTCSLKPLALLYEKEIKRPNLIDLRLEQTPVKWKSIHSLIRINKNSMTYWELCDKDVEKKKKNSKFVECQEQPVFMT